jgi:uroporphyrinogen-III synthase
MLKPSPLLEKKVLVPRGKKEAKSFSQLVEKYGGIPVEIPLIAFRPIGFSMELESTLKKLSTYDWIIFTSKVTVETFFSFFEKEAVDGLPKIAVIGKKTAEKLEQIGLTPDFIPSSYISETFAVEFAPLVSGGCKVLIPKGNLAREHIATVLTESGAYVDEMVIYETYMPAESRQKLAEMMAERQLDLLLFTSPSTVDHFMSVIEEFQLDDALGGCLIGCIGPVTEKKLKEYGLEIHASPEEYTVEEMLKSAIAYLEHHE